MQGRSPPSGKGRQRRWHRASPCFSKASYKRQIIQRTLEMDGTEPTLMLAGNNSTFPFFCETVPEIVRLGLWLTEKSEIDEK